MMSERLGAFEIVAGKTDPNRNLRPLFHLESVLSTSERLPAK